MQPKAASPNQLLVDQIAAALGETAPQALAQLRRAVLVLGRDRALAFLRQAQEIEAHGGMALPDGSRRRTSGGVFFRLVRDGTTPQERAAIRPRSRGPERPATAPPPTPPEPA